MFDMPCGTYRTAVNSTKESNLSVKSILCAESVSKFVHLWNKRINFVSLNVERYYTANIIQHSIKKPTINAIMMDLVVTFKLLFSRRTFTLLWTQEGSLEDYQRDILMFRFLFILNIKTQKKSVIINSFLAIAAILVTNLFCQASPH